MLITGPISLLSQEAEWSIKVKLLLRKLNLYLSRQENRTYWLIYHKLQDIHNFKNTLYRYSHMPNQKTESKDGPQIN